MLLLVEKRTAKGRKRQRKKLHGDVMTMFDKVREGTATWRKGQPRQRRRRINL